MHRNFRCVEFEIETNVALTGQSLNDTQFHAQMLPQRLSNTDIMAATDLYGFPLANLSELDRAQREASDGSSQLQEPLWMAYIAKDRLPNSDSKVKEMIRKVSRIMCLSTHPRSVGLTRQG